MGDVFWATMLFLNVFLFAVGTWLVTQGVWAGWLIVLITAFSAAILLENLGVFS